MPVLITNFLDKSGDYPNADGTSMSTWKLFRRFFIYDTVSGVENDFASGDYIPTVVRYPNSITLQVTLDPD